jgi:hypothetical protein
MGDGTRIGAGAKNENASSRVKCPQMHQNPLIDRGGLFLMRAADLNCEAAVAARRL